MTSLNKLDSIASAVQSHADDVALGATCHCDHPDAAWIDSYDLASTLQAEVTYVQHCLREALHVERFCYGEGWYLCYLDAHLTHQPGTRPFMRVPTRRDTCPCCYLEVTTTGECPL